MATDIIATTKVWEDLPIPKSTRTRRVLRYSPGHAIPADRAKALRVGKDGRQKSVPTATVDETGVIPLNR